MVIQLLSVLSFFEHQKEIDTIQDIISQHFAGVIMLPSCWHDDLYRLLQNAGIPVVMLDQIPASMRHFPVDCVISDNYKGGALLAEHLFGKKATQGLDHGTVSGRLHDRAADPGLCGCISENGIDLLKQQDSFPLFLLVPLLKLSSRATCISRSLLILPIPLLLDFFLTAISPQWVV